MFLHFLESACQTRIRQSKIGRRLNDSTVATKKFILHSTVATIEFLVEFLVPRAVLLPCVSYYYSKIFPVHSCRYNLGVMISHDITVELLPSFFIYLFTILFGKKQGNLSVNSIILKEFMTSKFNVVCFTICHFQYNI